MTPQQFAGAGCGRRYEQEYINKFRDCLTFYYDGKIRFERFCYGEGACFVFGAWATLQPDGQLIYKEPLEPLADPAALPRCLTATEADALVFDGRRFKWHPVAQLKQDPKNGYTPVKMLFSKLFRR